MQAIEGRVSLDGGILRIDNCKELLVLSSTKTDYNSRKPDSPLKNDLGTLNRNILDAASRAGWKKLEQETAKYFSERMMRCQVDIGDTPAETAQKTTPERLQLVRQGGKDPDLIEQLFQFGRYCIIANTRPGALPCGLQGLWNPDLNAAWKGCFFLNINCQMNQWPADVTGLGEYHRPFLEFVVSLQPTGEKFARFLKLDGFCFAHNVDCWKETYYVGNVPEYSASLMNGAWACAHLMDSYRFTGDKAFLKKSIPILESNARFIMSWFQKDGKGRYISGPGTSPENIFRVLDETGKKSTFPSPTAVPMISCSAGNPCATTLPRAGNSESIRQYWQKPSSSCRTSPSRPSGRTAASGNGRNPLRKSRRGIATSATCTACSREMNGMCSTPLNTPPPSRNPWTTAAALPEKAAYAPAGAPRG